MQPWHLHLSPACSDDASRKSLRSLRNCTVAFWCGFPLVWTLVQLRLVESLRAEEMLWSCCDLLGKVSALYSGEHLQNETRQERLWHL